MIKFPGAYQDLLMSFSNIAPLEEYSNLLNFKEIILCRIFIYFTMLKSFSTHEAFQQTMDQILTKRWTGKFLYAEKYAQSLALDSFYYVRDDERMNAADWIKDAWDDFGGCEPIV